MNLSSANLSSLVDKKKKKENEKKEASKYEYSGYSAGVVAVCLFAGANNRQQKLQPEHYKFSVQRMLLMLLVLQWKITKRHN
ncbi:hypothetical protein TYRP_018734 [Tyrophagus putrescentiae]|nr:hypothetical protein TYRP_018734 [Tyrophagus putrescentiae]